MTLNHEATRGRRRFFWWFIIKIIIAVPLLAVGVFLVKSSEKVGSIASVPGYVFLTISFISLVARRKFFIVVSIAGILLLIAFFIILSKTFRAALSV